MAAGEVRGDYYCDWGEQLCRFSTRFVSDFTTLLVDGERTSPFHCHRCLGRCRIAWNHWLFGTNSLKIDSIGRRLKNGRGLRQIGEFEDLTYWSKLISTVRS